MVSWAIELTSRSPGFSLSGAIPFGRLLTDGFSLTLELPNRAWTDGPNKEKTEERREKTEDRRQKLEVRVRSQNPKSRIPNAERQTANGGCEGPQPSKSPAIIVAKTVGIAGRFP